MHILMTVNAAWNVGNFRRPLVEAMIAEGHHITVLAPPDDTTSDLARLGCRFVPLAMNVKGLNPIEDLNLVRRFRQLFRTERPDVVLSFTIKNNIFGALAARPTGVPFVPNVTGLGTAFLSGGMLQAVAERLYRKAFRALPVIFFQNEEDRDLFVHRGLIRFDQTQLLPGSGIDLTRFPVAPMPSPDEPPVFLMIARLLRDKGVIEFIEAARRVKAKRPDVRFQLLGAIGSENRTAIGAETVQAWVDEGVVEYLGTTSDVRPHIASSTCTVLPSYREGAPRTLIEAAAMGRPVITTDVPGCRSVIDRNESGFLCDVRSAEGLATAMDRFLDLPPAARTAMGAAGRRKMEREFDHTIVVDAYRQALYEIIGLSDPQRLLAGQ